MIGQRGEADIIHQTSIACIGHEGEENTEASEEKTESIMGQSSHKL